jgi:hypothetical protein
LSNYTLLQLRAELERRGCRQHPNPGGIVVPIGEVWIHPNGATRIIIPRPVNGIIPVAVVKDLLEEHDIPEPRPGN